MRSYQDPEEGDVYYKEKVLAIDQMNAASDVLKTLQDKELNKEEKLHRMRARMEVARAAKLTPEKLLNLKMKDYGLFVRAQEAHRLAVRAESEIKKLEAEESTLHLQMKVESVLSQEAAESIDMSSPAAKKALERLSVQFPSVREEAEKTSFNKGALPVPIEPTPVVEANLTGELRSIYELYRQYDLSEVQLRVMNVVANPSVCIEAYGSISKQAIAQCLGLPESEVIKAFDKRLLATIYNESVMALRLSKFSVDGALMASASNPSPKNNSDRLLYYRLIGALQDKSDQNVIDKIPREKKLEVISKTIAKLTRSKEEANELTERILKGANQ